MSVLPVYLYGTKVLRSKAKPVRTLSNNIIKLVYDMVETMHAANGMGLAANQVGALHRVIAVDISSVNEQERQEEGEEPHMTSPDLPRKIVMINPVIRGREGVWKMQEGCLSIPELHGAVERADTIQIKYRDPNFDEKEIVADGLLARVILHEVDHLDGVLFTDLISSTDKAEVKKELKRIKQGDVEAGYPVVTVEEE